MCVNVLIGHETTFQFCIIAVIKEYVNPCQPSPCGPNSQCRELNEQAVCSCLPEYVGVPPSCRPECTSSSECPSELACVNQKCQDPCPGVCGHLAECKVRNHVPLCSCQIGYTGDPFTRCYPLPRKSQSNSKSIISEGFASFNLAPPPIKMLEPLRDPCVPSPCGLNAQCRHVNGQASCSCLPQFLGAPPNCRPECSTNAECPLNMTCINMHCVDPCPGSCAYNALCSVQNHIPSCYCPEGYIGDPFTSCQLAPKRKNFRLR